jgi:hypothetical protein
MKLLIALIAANIALGAAVWSEVAAQRRLGHRFSIGNSAASRGLIGSSSEAVGPK